MTSFRQAVKSKLACQCCCWAFGLIRMQGEPWGQWGYTGVRPVLQRGRSALWACKQTLDDHQRTVKTKVEQTGSSPATVMGAPERDPADLLQEETPELPHVLRCSRVWLNMCVWGGVVLLYCEIEGRVRSQVKPWDLFPAETLPPVPFLYFYSHL